MLNYVVFLAAPRQVNDLARSALPDAPVVSDVPRRRAFGLLSRQRVSVTLRRLADAIEPAPACRPAALAPRQ